MEKQRWEESAKRREEARRSEKRERVRRKKMQVREKVGKSRITVFYQWFVVGTLKRWVRNHLARWEMKNCTPWWREAHFEVKSVKNWRYRSTFGSWQKCTPLWCEAHLEVKMHKALQCRTTFRSWDVEKVHAVVARSTFRSQNAQGTPGSEHF